MLIRSVNQTVSLPRIYKICTIDRIHLFSTYESPLKFIAVKQEGVIMLRITIGLLLLITCSAPAFAQAAKGVDKQNERVRDSGSERTPANNGNKTDVGAGRGFDFGSGRTPATPPLPKPYRPTGRPEPTTTAMQELIRDRTPVMDEVTPSFRSCMACSKRCRCNRASVA